MSKLCIKCGKELSDNAVFCRHCGSPQDKAGNAAPERTDKTVLFQPQSHHNEQSQNPNPYAQQEQPQNPNPYAPQEQPQNPNPYAQQGQPQNPNPYAQQEQPQNPNPYAPQGQPQNPNPYAPQGQPQNPNPYAPQGQPQNPNPYAQQGQPPYQPYQQNPYGQQPYDPYGMQPQLAGQFQPQTKTKKKGVLIAVIASSIGVVLIGAAIFIYFFFIADAHHAPIEEYFKARIESDIKYLDDAYPDFVIEYEKSEDENFEESWNEKCSRKKITSYNIGSSRKVDSDDINEMENAIKDKYDKKIEIEEAYDVNVDYTIKNKNGDPENESCVITVYKMKGNWYVFNI